MLIMITPTQIFTLSISRLTVLICSRYTAKEAKELCENDLQCAGLTFKGAFAEDDLKFFVYFFHFVSDSTYEKVKSGRNHLHWSTYRTKRGFVALQGDFGMESTEIQDGGQEFRNSLRKKPRKHFKWPLDNASAVKLTADKAEAIEKVNFLTFEPDSTVTTIIDLKAGKSRVIDSRISLDNCCKEDDASKVATLPRFFQTVPSVSCGVTPRQFDALYVKSRSPVMLSECAAVCTAQNWTMLELAKKFGDANAFLGKTEMKTFDTIAGIEKAWKEAKSDLEVIHGRMDAPQSADLLKFAFDSDVHQLGPDTANILQLLGPTVSQSKVVIWANKDHRKC